MSALGGASAVGSVRASHVTTFTIKAAGRALGEAYAVVSVEVRREVARVPRATIVLRDGDAAAQTFARSEEDTLLPGVEVEILGGYSSDEASLFKGVITRHRVEVGAHGGSQLIVELSDPVFRMTVGRHSRSFTDVTDADVIEQLIADYPGITAEVAPTTLVHPQLVQHQLSDWDFLITRAEAAGACVVCVDGTLAVAPPATTGAASATAIFGQGLLAAQLELDAEIQVTSVEAAAWDPASQELAVAESDDAPSAGPGDVAGAELARTAGRGTTLRHAGARDQAVLDQWSETTMGRTRRAAVRGRVRVQGTEALRPGVLIELAGFGRRFDGLAFVSGVRHRLGRGDWVTEALIGSDPRPHAERHALAAGTNPPVQGLHIGIVTALTDDPAGEARVQIRLPTITATDGLVWARQALLDAGVGRGTCFHPDIGDEVVVGYLDADPRDPVVLGALHSSARPRALAVADDNHEKGIVTRSGMRAHWNDDTIVTTLDTPLGNRIVLSEADAAVVIEDQHGNVVTLDADGVTIASKGDLVLTARGDVRLRGNHVELAAKASLKASGSAGAELGSSATTAIKGSLVTIN